jgi:hypothetical protein
MWFDVLKNQISVGRQKLRSSKKPLPDEDNDEDCRTKFKRLVQSLESSSKIKGIYGSSLMRRMDDKSNSDVYYCPDNFFCKAIEALIAYVDEYKTSYDIPLTTETSGFYDKTFYGGDFRGDGIAWVCDRGSLYVSKYNPVDYNRMEGKLNTRKMLLHFTIKLYGRGVFALDFELDGYKVLETDDEPEEILEDKYQELRTIIMRYS